MGRMHPTRCQHGVLVDVGSFDGLLAERCERCDKAADEFRRRATTGYDDLEGKLDTIECVLLRYADGLISDVECIARIGKEVGLIPNEKTGL